MEVRKGLVNGRGKERGGCIEGMKGFDREMKGVVEGLT